MFNSVLSCEMTSYIELRKQCVTQSSIRGDICVLKSLDQLLISNNISDKRISEELISAWMHSLTGASKTVSDKVIILRGFVKYLQSMGIYCFLPESPRCKSDYIPYIFSDEELSAIIRIADNLKDMLLCNQHTPNIELVIPMVLRILMGCGTRLGETMELKRMDVDFEHRTLLLRITKYSRERMIPVHDSLIRILERYCLALGIMYEPNAYLFPGKKLKTHLTTRQVDEWFSRILEVATIDRHQKEPGKRGACLHCLRHVFVLKSMQQLEKAGHSVDMNDLLLPTYLGHKCLLDTDRYMRLSGAQSPETIERFESFTVGLIPNVEDAYEEE